MPILAPNAAQLAGLPVDYLSRLPPTEVINGAVNPIFAALTAADFGATHLGDADRLAAMVGRGVAVSTGWPAMQLDDLASVVSESLRNIDPAKVQALIDGAADAIDLFEELQDALAEAITGVPIVGWIVSLGRIVYRVVELARFAAPTIAKLEALAYNKPSDDWIAQRLTARVESLDWTPMFEPPPGGWKVEPIAYTASGAPDGIAFGQLFGANAQAPGVDAKTFGMVPGVATMAGYWQTPRKVPGSTRDANIANIVGSSQILPSASTLSGVLWTANQSAGPMLARLDLHALASAWESYGDELVGFAKSRDGWQRSQIEAAWRWTYDGAPLYGLKTSDVPAEYRGWGLHNLIAYELERARTRVRKNMSTLAVAYVPPNAPGLSDAPTRAAWAKHRAKLLIHDARMAVDPSVIPDVDYRDAMILAQKQGSTDLSANVTPAPKKPGMPSMDRLSGAPPEPPTPPAIPGGGPEGADAPTSGAGFGLAAIAVLALWALARR